jgi:hypothetical protein
MGVDDALCLELPDSIKEGIKSKVKWAENLERPPRA